MTDSTWHSSVHKTNILALVLPLIHLKSGFYLFICGFYVTFNIQGHIAMGSLRVEEPVHTSWSRFCTVNHWASASNYQLPNMKRPARDSNRRPQRLEARTLTATPLSPLLKSGRHNATFIATFMKKFKTYPFAKAHHPHPPK